jgi:hypothetical protein
LFVTMTIADNGTVRAHESNELAVACADEAQTPNALMMSSADTRRSVTCTKAKYPLSGSIRTR